MKLLIFVCTIFVLSYIHLSEGECDDTLWVAVPNIEMKKIHGRWYSVLRFANGDDDNSDCLWHDVKAHPSIPGAVTDAVRRTFKTGKGHAKKTIDGAVSLSKAGKFHHEYQKGATVDTVVVDIDYDEYALLRACYGDDEIFWAYARNQYPSNSTFTKIYEAIDKHGIDRSKLVKSCTDVKASEIV